MYTGLVLSAVPNDKHRITNIRKSERNLQAAWKLEIHRREVMTLLAKQCLSTPPGGQISIFSRGSNFTITVFGSQISNMAESLNPPLSYEASATTTHPHVATSLPSEVVSCLKNSRFVSITPFNI